MEGKHPVRPEVPIASKPNNRNDVKALGIVPEILVRLISMFSKIDEDAVVVFRLKIL